MKKVTKTSSGINASLVLFLILLTLKLTYLIDWSWWWITCPLWVGIVAYLFVTSLSIGIVLIVLFINLLKK
jgi:hypothetical protein